MFNKVEKQIKQHKCELRQLLNENNNTKQYIIIITII